MNKEISNKINIIRIISMILILLCHYFQYYNLYLAYWLNVGVQMFFIISGILYGSKDITDIKQFYKSRILKIIIPYYIVLIIFFGFSYLLEKNQFNYLDIFYYFSASQAFNTSISSISHLWFISYIILFYLILPILQKYDISKNKKFYIILPLILIVLQLLQFLNIININISFLNLFIISYYFSRRYFKHKIKDNYKLIYLLTLIICIVGIPFQIFLEKQMLGGIAHKFMIVNYYYNLAILGINIFLLLIKIVPSINNKIINYFSKISYYVFLTHQIFIFNNFSLLEYNHGILLSLIAIFIASNLLYYICNWIIRKFIT